MMQAAALNQSASADAPAEVSATPASGKTSFWSRVKSAAVNTAKRIAKPFTFVAAKAAPVAKKAAKAVKRVATKVAAKVSSTAKAVFAKVSPATDKAVSWTKATWKRVLKPFLKLRMIAFGIIFAVVALFVAPLATLLFLGAVGAFLVVLSYGIEALEKSDSKAARIALRTIEMFFSFIKGAAYAATALLTVLMSIGSWAFAITEVLELALRYYDVEGAVSLATLAYCVLTGQWVLFTAIALLYFRRPSTGRSLRRPVVEQQPVVHAGGNRRVKLPKCTVCGLDDGGARYALHGRRGMCGGCFEHLSNEDALEAARKGRISPDDLKVAKAHGVDVDPQVSEAVAATARSRFRALMGDEIEALPAKSASRLDPTKPLWAEVAWWLDDEGKPRTRKWLCFVAGEAVASVDYDHRAKGRRHRARLLTPNGDRTPARFDKFTPACEYIEQALSDEVANVNGMLDNLREEAEATKVVEAPDADENVS